MVGLRVCEELRAWIWDWGLFFVWVDFWCEGAVGGFVKVVPGCDKSLTVGLSDVCVFTKMPS